jgi:Flp pilus assembly protein TadD
MKWHEQGFDLIDTGQNQEAILAFDKAISIDPENVHAWNGRGTAFFNLGDNSEALKAFNQAISIDSTYAHAYIGKGNVLYALSKFNESLDEFDKAIALDPDITWAWNGKGTTLLELGLTDQSAAAFDRAIALDPENPHAWAGRGYLLLKLGKNQEALESFNQALSIDPNNKPAQDGKEQALNPAGAGQSYDEAKAYVEKGNTYFSQGRYDDAMSAFEKAISLNQNDAPAWAGKGHVLIHRGRCDEAEETFTKALSIDPRLDWAKNGLYKAKDPTACKEKASTPQPTSSSQGLTGWIDADQTWSGTVRVTGEIWLAKDVTLKIDPGTTVYITPNSNDQHQPRVDFSDEYTTKYNDPVRLASWSSNAITIDGRDGIIEVIGTPENPVVFKPEGNSTSPAQWNGIYIGRGTIQDTHIYYAGQTAMNIFGDYPGTVEISHNEVKYFHWAGIDSHRNNVWIHDNIVEGGGHQGIGVRYNTLAENNVISRAATGIGVEDANGAVIRHNTVIDCPVGIGLRSGTTAEVTDNIILKQNGYPDGWYYQGTLVYPASSGGLSAMFNHLTGSVKIENNTVSI